MSETPKYSELLLSDRGKAMHLFLEGGIFLSAYSPHSKKGCAILLRDIDKNKFAESIEKFEGFLGEKLPNCELKAVGIPTTLQKGMEILSGLGVKLAASVSRNSQRVEIVFYAESGRLRVALDSRQNEASQEPETAKIRAKTRVLIVDDSATIRKLLTNIFSSDPELEVVGATEFPKEVESLIERLKPNVITLDIHMPEMDGVSLLKQLMPKYHLPVVMITSISMEEGPKVLDALENGAVDYIQKPSFAEMSSLAPLIIEKIKIAAKSKLLIKTSDRIKQRGMVGGLNQSQVVAIGSSTGGTEALKELLIRLPDNIPPILCVQHIPAVFSLDFAKRLNSLCPFEVKEAADGDEVRARRVLIAPGGKQMKVKKHGPKLLVSIDDSPPVNRHKPSVDVLFDSVANEIGKNAVGIILTGMGADGARGLLKMKQNGALTIAQDQESCVVFGMPREAIKLGAATEVRPLLEIPELLTKWLGKSDKAA